MSARDEAVEMIRRICPPHLDRDEYGRILAEKFDSHRAELLAEADLLPKADIVAWLTKKAREFRSLGHEQGRAQGDAVAAMASKVDRGAVRPDNLRTGPADFFEPGRSYTTDRYPSLRFVCEHLTTDPKTGAREAWGWLHRSDGTRRMERMWDGDWSKWTEAGDPA